MKGLTPQQREKLRKANEPVPTEVVLLQSSDGQFQLQVHH